MGIEVLLPFQSDVGETRVIGYVFMRSGFREIPGVFGFHIAAWTGDVERELF